MATVWVVDEDSKRHVYVGEQRDEPPRVIEIASRSVSFDGEQIFLRRTRYTKIAVDGEKHIYKQEGTI